VKTILIAEIGKNHSGNWDICRAFHCVIPL